MSFEHRVADALWRTLPLLPQEVREELIAILSPGAIAVMAGTLAAWIASHSLGVGLIADGVLALAGVAFLGAQFSVAASQLVEATRIIHDARTTDDLDRAAHLLAGFMTQAGVSVFSALLLKVGRKRASTALLSVHPVRSGMTSDHFAVFRNVASAEKRVILMRNTNPASTELIARDCPAKPLEIKSHTDPKTGVVTVRNLSEESEAYRAGYFVVDEDGIPRKGIRISTYGKTAERPSLQWDERPFWDVQRGQVIDPTTKKPLVADYDVLGIFDPKRPVNMVVYASGGVPRKNVTTPEIQRLTDRLNSEMGSRRVMHGAYDQWLDGGSLKNVKAATVFYPDGTVEALESSAAVAAFYARAGRTSLFIPKPERPPAQIIDITKHLGR